jgi:hypothetical protein
VVLLVKFVYAGILDVPDVGLKFPKPTGTVPCKLHVKLTPGVVLFKFTKDVFCPVQIVWFPCENVVTGAGLTVIE